MLDDRQPFTGGAMIFFRGDRIRYLGRPDWGPGQVLADSRDGKVLVRFETAGTMLLALSYAKIFKVRPCPAGMPGGYFPGREEGSGRLPSPRPSA